MIRVLSLTSPTWRATKKHQLGGREVTNLPFGSDLPLLFLGLVASFMFLSHQSMFGSCGQGLSWGKYQDIVLLLLLAQATLHLSTQLRLTLNR